MSGELLLSIGFGLSMFMVGALAHWQVNKAYSRVMAEKPEVTVMSRRNGKSLT
ncbi:hypothetical protein [Oceanimonas doudoroffii]|uniref:hypothetical protein n=1 Tax=Oceanimonas doudoroffii TaxID=84158 RepID=UPI00146E41BE|nr:hypothetical protein [Oceanimonas doudoroffii]